MGSWWSSNDSSSDSENELFTESEFNRAVRACGFSNPPSDVYEHLLDATSGFSRGELAMLLAQLIHESAGFQEMEEYDYRYKKNHGDYRDEYSLPGRDYHGRGYIQLTWAENYKAASEGLYGDDRLLRKPHLVAASTRVAVRTSIWYWKEMVRPELRRRGRNKFGVTTDAINGALECNGRNTNLARNRYKKYLKVANVLGIENKASESGCYN